MLCNVHPSGGLMLYNLSLISNKQNPTDLLIDVMVLHVTFSASFIIPFYSGTMDIGHVFLVLG
jgi:hypothetical protein